MDGVRRNDFLPLQAVPFVGSLAIANRPLTCPLVCTSKSFPLLLMPVRQCCRAASVLGLSRNRPHVASRQPPVGVPLRWRALPQCSQLSRAARKYVRRCLATRSRLGSERVPPPPGRSGTTCGALLDSRAPGPSGLSHGTREHGTPSSSPLHSRDPLHPSVGPGNAPSAGVAGP